jgi:hypothetical protein
VMPALRCLVCDVTFMDVHIYSHPSHGCLSRSAALSPERSVEPPARRLRAVPAVAHNHQLITTGRNQ